MFFQSESYFDFCFSLAHNFSHNSNNIPGYGTRTVPYHIIRTYVSYVIM